MPTRGSMVIGGETITWRETPKQEIGFSHDEPTSRREWMFDGSLDRDKIIAAVAVVVPAIDICGGVPRFYVRHDVKEQGGKVWTVPVQYRNKPTYWDMSIDISSGNAKILQSYKTVRGYECTGLLSDEDPELWETIGAIPNFKKAINVNGDTVDGAKMEHSDFAFSVNYKYIMSALPASYLMTLYSLRGKANDASYTLMWKNQSLTFAAGDLLFLGATGKQTSDDQVDLTFKFSASKGLAGGSRTTGLLVQPAVGVSADVLVDRVSLYSINAKVYIVGKNDSGASVEGGEYTIDDISGNYLSLINLGSTGSAAPGTLIVPGALISYDHTDRNPLVIGSSNPIKKKGWEYLWVRYEERSDPTTGGKVKLPIAAYVEQVVKYGDLNLLGIA